MNGRDQELQILWRGANVGTLKNVEMDHGYFDGIWVATESELARKFEEAARGLDPRAVLEDGTRGIRAVAGSGSWTTHVLVLSLADGRLLIRWILGDEAVAWLLANVGE
jgi:hypothetical protein